MSAIKMRAGATAELINGQIIASVDIAAPPERTFRALASQEIVDWCWSIPASSTPENGRAKSVSVDGGEPAA